MAKISVIGICGNSIFMGVDHFHEKGETLVAHTVYEEIGGKGINQAIACARMGAEVAFLAAIGDDKDGETCRRVAEDNGIRGCFAVKEGLKTTFAVILTNRHGDNQVTGYHAAELTEADVLAFEDEIASSDILLLQNEVPVAVNELAARLAEKHGVRVILNPAPIREISDAMARRVFAVTPNEQEARAIAPNRFANCLTTLGDKGCSLGGGTVIPALPVQAVDTTGAGDTFNGVLAVCVAEGMSLADACRYGVIASGLSVTKPYVLQAIPTRDEIERTMNHE